MINGESIRLNSQISLNGNEPDRIIVIDGRSGTMVSCDESTAQLCATLQKDVAASELVRLPERLGK